MPKKPSQELIHHYRRLRQHQMATYDNSGLHIDGRDAREFTGGGAAYGYHASAAFLGAKRSIHLRNVLAAESRKAKKRAAQRRAKRKAAQRASV